MLGQPSPKEEAAHVRRQQAELAGEDSSGSLSTLLPCIPVSSGNLQLPGELLC